MPATVVVLVGLFVVQSRGSPRIGMLIEPIISIWCAALALAGLWQVAQMPAVLAALDPLLGPFVRPRLDVPSPAWLGLSGPYRRRGALCDMGYFGQAPIRLDWFSLVPLALVLNHFGQRALVLAHPDAIDSPFYRVFQAGHCTRWSSLPLRRPSQAVISGAFSLSQQGMQLSLLLRLDVRQTSSIT